MSIVNHTEVDDTLDFISNKFQKLNEQMRCSICKELLTSAMILNTCSHSFCALCVRKSLSTKPACPKCKKPATEANLIHNYDLDSLIQIWRDSRKFILTVDKMNSTIPIKDNESKNPSKLQCSICSQYMVLNIPDNHIGDCFHGKTSPLTHSSKTKKDVDLGKKPIKLVYAMMKDKELKACLKSFNLPDHGDRSQKIWRHREYINLYNANNDSQNPVNAQVLVQRLIAMEKSRLSEKSKKITDPEIHKAKYSEHFSSLIQGIKKRKSEYNDIS